MQTLPLFTFLQTELCLGAKKQATGKFLLRNVFYRFFSFFNMPGSSLAQAGEEMDEFVKVQVPGSISGEHLSKIQHNFST